MKFLRWIKRIFFGIIVFVLVSFMAWLIILRINYVPPILMYHSIAEGAGHKNRLIVDPEYFERQMKFLHDNNFNVVYVEKIAELIKNKKPIPPRTIAVTFDDGYANNFTNALPVLKKYNIPATIFVIVELINVPEYMTLEQLRVASDSGVVEIGSHTLSHLWLTNSDDEAMWRKEIIDSKKALEKILGKEIKSFCYPGGAFNEKIKKIVKEAGYEVAVTTSPGKEFSNDDIYALKRLRISSTSRNLFVFWIKCTGSYLFIKERRDDY